MTDSELIQIVLMGLLVVVTGIYAWRTFAISNATKKQAEEMRKDRILASRPVIVIKPIHEPAGVSADYSQSYFSHFEIYNEGSGPAVNLEIRVLNKDKNCLDEKTILVLRARETMKFFPDTPLVNQEGSICHLLCCYRSVLSKSTGTSPYQTCLRFEIKKSNRGQDTVIVCSDKLLFGDEDKAFCKKS